MPLTLDDLNKNGIENGIYKEERRPLSLRIDYAWSIYSAYKDKNDPNEAKIAQNALEFLIYAFDLTSANNINEQLIQLMQEKEQYKGINPEYIPGKAPQRLPFNYKTIIPTQTLTYGQASSPEVTQAILKRELLDVNDRSKKLDLNWQTLFFNNKGRSGHRVIFREGLFVKEGKPFDTSQMISHKKPGFAAYTLNTNGELSVFNHYKMADDIAHSSMNAGAPVVAAGELKINKGVLEKITIHSGHYNPSLFNVYRFLEHLSHQGVDISQAKVVTMKDPQLLIKNIHSQPVVYDAYKSNDHDGTMYESLAREIYKGIHLILQKNIQVIDQQIKKYQSRGIISSIYKIKDSVQGSTLTQQRQNLAADFEKEIRLFKSEITPNLTARELKVKLAVLEGLISKYEEKNNQLADSFGKERANGKLSKTFSQLKKDFTDLNANNLERDISENQSVSLKLIF